MCVNVCACVLFVHVCVHVMCAICVCGWKEVCKDCVCMCVFACVHVSCVSCEWIERVLLHDEQFIPP